MRASAEYIILGDELSKLTPTNDTANYYQK